MKPLRILLLCAAGLSLVVQVAFAADENRYLGEIHIPPEQTIGHGRSALWALPDVATQYQPSQPIPAIREALQAQQEGSFLDALIRLEDAARGGTGDEDVQAEINLLRASFLLQGHQAKQALEVLTPLFTSTRHAAAVHALVAMAHLQQGAGQKALEAAQQAQKTGDGVLPHLALSYALQGEGRLAEAHDAVHGFNSREPQQAVSLAREAELALTLDQPAAARALVNRAQQLDAAHPYVAAVSGLVYLIDGEARKAKAAFEAALRRDPRDARALFGLGLAETRLGNFGEGQEKLQAAHEADPGSALITTYLARAQLRAGRTSEAGEHLRDAQEADPKDPIPWLYQAQAQLQANRPQQAQESLREAQARTAYRSVYRGENLIREDEQLLRANLAEVQRRLGQEDLAFHTLSDTVGEKSSATLRNQADLLQGRRFGESARRSLLLQSLFGERPGNLPSPLDIYGDGAGQTGAATPQHGAVSALSAQHTSYNTYDELFGARTALAADAVTGGQNTNGEQVRFGYGSDTLGLGLAQRQFRTNGNGRFENLDNRIGQAILQWRLLQTTQVFVTHQAFNSQHGETLFPADPGNAAQPIAIADNSQVTRLGLRHSLTDDSELRTLWSHQQTDQTYDYLDPVTGISFWTQPGNSDAHGAELQYRTSGTTYATQWGVQQTRAQIIYPGSSDNTRTARQLYAAWQQALGPHWRLDAQLARGKIDNRDNLKTWIDNSTYLKRWLPRLGLAYAPDSGTHVRVAAWHDMGFGEIGDAALAPASVAGFLLARPGDTQLNGLLVRAVALGADEQLSSAWSLEGQLQRRRTDQPSIRGGQQIFSEWQTDESRLALYWHPESRPWAASLAYEQERYRAPSLSTFIALDSVQQQRLRALQLDMRWFASEHWTARLGLSHNRADGLLETNWFTTLLPYRDSFDQADASLDWQFAKSSSLSAGVRNATDRRFRYTNIDPLTPRFSNGRLAYATIRLAW